MRGTFLRHGWMLAFILVCGCADDAARSTTAPTPRASLSASSEPVTWAPVVVRFDGEKMAAIEAAAISERTLLASLLPEEQRDTSQWRSLTARSADGTRTLDLQRFAVDYADFDVALYIDPKHGPSVGLFRRLGGRKVPAHVREAMSKPHLRLVGAAFVEVRTREVPKPPEPEQSTLVLSLGSKTRSLTPADLAELTMSKPPELEGARPRGKRRRQRAGWHLREVLSSLSKPEAIAYVVAHGPKRTLRIEGPWTDDRRVPLLRRTRRGHLELSIWTSSRAEPEERLKNVTKLELFLAK